MELEKQKREYWNVNIRDFKRKKGKLKLKFPGFLIKANNHFDCEIETKKGMKFSQYLARIGF